MNPAAPSERLTFLDHIRGIAILFVVTFHALQPAFGRMELDWVGVWRDFGGVPKSFLPMLPFMFGRIGVAIFFVVSGFCIHLSHQRSREKGFHVFFIRRFFRIYPPYLLSLLFFGLVFPPTRLVGDWAAQSGQMISHLLLVHNFSQDWVVAINGSFWSIAPEFQLYLLYPLLLGGVAKWGWKGALWLVALVEIPMRVVSALGGLGGLEQTAWGILPFYFWFSWAIGAKLADDWLGGRPIFMRNVPGWIFPLATLASLFFKPLSAFTFLFEALMAAQWIAVLLARPRSAASSRPSWASEALRGLGVVSYSVYLINEPLLSALPEALRWAFPHVYFHPLKIYAIALALCGAMSLFAVLLYRWVELPSIEWGKRWVKRVARREQAAATVAP